MTEDWLETLTAARKAGEACVLVTIVEARGSTPRPAGTKMAVFPDRFAGSIGGGALERKALETARRFLAEGRDLPSLREFPLGPALGQCCGGHCSLMFEPIASPSRTLMLFGAGHVGRALVRVLEGTPLRVRWIDSREDEFPAAAPGNVAVTVTSTPEAEIASAPDGALILVMTHSHDLDYRLVEAALEQGTFSFLGLIGSATKRARFEKRLTARGLNPGRLTCPIGLPGVGGNHPAEIAISVAGQILSLPTSETARSGQAEAFDIP